ncbi:MAG: asparagine synthase-related protein, partial [Hyphomicrobium sp.]
DAEATDRLEVLLKDAISRQMIADVPLGAFLSGGIDSSTVVALMQAQSSRPVRTFTIGFNEVAYNEAGHAADVARHLGTDHTTLIVEPRDALAVIPKLADIYDEPFADASQIPTMLLSELTRRHVTVALSGDGGDELLAGYTRYGVAEQRWAMLSRIPRHLAKAASAAGLMLSASNWDRMLGAVPTAIQSRLTGESARGFAAVLGAGGFGELYRRQLSHWADPALLMPGDAEAKGLAFDPALDTLFPDVVDRMRYLDTLTYLPDDILTKVDRASMNVSLEARVPLLDHRVVELCWRLPKHQMVRDGTTKWLLRNVLGRHVPAALINRPKMGFGVPIDSWLRGPLRDWAESLLSETELRR